MTEYGMKKKYFTPEFHHLLLPPEFWIPENSPKACCCLLL
jgi:hypothetical protein